jgi:hypothetical protein
MIGGIKINYNRKRDAVANFLLLVLFCFGCMLITSPLYPLSTCGGGKKGMSYENQPNADKTGVNPVDLWKTEGYNPEYKTNHR